MAQASVYRIKPYQYIHVSDNNTGITRVELGPQTFTRQDHEKVIAGPEAMIIIPPRHYAIVQNPVVRDDKGQAVKDKHNNYVLRRGDEEIRFSQPPFALYPDEKLIGKVTPLTIVAADSALRLRAIRDFTHDKTKFTAGDEWLFKGPDTYIPRVEVQVVEIIRAIIIGQHEAIRLRARREFTDRNKQVRKAGEEWLIREVGSFLPDVDEEVVETVKGIVLTDKKALHLRAVRTYTEGSVTRRAGEEWLVTSADAQVYIPDVNEEIVGTIPITVLNNRQYCVVLDPIGSDGKPQLGKRDLRKGEAVFFLRPGEKLESGIQNVHVLSEDESLLLRAKEEFIEGKTRHSPGDRWMIYGPCDFVPPVEVEIIEKRRSIPLHESEGIYVRDIQTGRIRSVIGTSYMLKPNEELWEKDLPEIVEQLLAKESTGAVGKRDRTRVVTLRAPANSAVQVFDYKEKKSRIVFGPELVALGPDEHFTVLSLSGGKPKQPHQIKALYLLLGPEFSTDVVTVETSDHARLQLKLSYNWVFSVDKTNEEDAKRIFQVPDFVGDLCKAIASQVRAAVASEPFDNFHKYSARIIRVAVFGKDEHDKIRDEYIFSSNGLRITNVDIQSVEPVDQRTRDSLQKSVQLAIEITTKSQEAAASHEASRLEQEAKGLLDRQKISDESESEKARQHLLTLQSQCATVESTGQATAEAKARADAAFIAGEAAVKQAQLKANATAISSSSELEMIIKRQNAEIEHQKKLDELELLKTAKLAEIESGKFKKIVTAIGPETIQAIAQAGPEMQTKLLQSLGLKSLLITDGNSPINLFNTAKGLIAGQQQQE